MTKNAVHDLNERAQLDNALARPQPARVKFFAAYAYVDKSAEYFALYYRNNVASTINPLDVMRATGNSYLVFSSTCAVYGTPKTMLIMEDHSRNPINPYGMTKLMIEHMLAAYQTAYGLRSYSLCYFNSAGAWAIPPNWWRGPAKARAELSW